MRTRKVYKVVLVYGGALKSTYAPNGFSKTYMVGKTTLPEPGTKLFAFTSLRQAKKYGGIGNPLPDDYARVYEAQATNVESNGWLSHEIYDLSILQKQFREHLMPKAEGEYSSCVVCDSIKLIRRIK